MVLCKLMKLRFMQKIWHQSHATTYSCRKAPFWDKAMTCNNTGCFSWCCSTEQLANLLTCGLVQLMQLFSGKAVNLFMITRLLCDADDRSNTVRYRGIDKTRFIAGQRQEHLNVSEISQTAFSFLLYLSMALEDLMFEWLCFSWTLKVSFPTNQASPCL